MAREVDIWGRPLPPDAEHRGSAFMDLAAWGFPQSEAEAERRGYDWKMCKEANDAQHEVAECRRRAQNNPDILNMRLD